MMPSESRAIPSDQASNLLQKAQSVSLVGLQMIPFGPFVPGIHEYQAFLRGAAPDRLHETPESCPKCFRRVVDHDDTIGRSPRRVVPTNEYRAEDRESTVIPTHQFARFLMVIDLQRRTSYA